MRILTFNCHEAWVYQLYVLGAELDIVVGLSGRYTQEWDLHMRPLPRKSRLLTLAEVLQESKKYDCIIVHNITDLLESKSINAPKIMVLHGTIEGRVANEQSDVPPQELKTLLRQYSTKLGVHAMAVSALKADSWGLSCDIVHNGVEVGKYPSYIGSNATGVRICNQALSRQQIIMWDFYQLAFGDLNVRLIGHNPDIPGSHVAKDWDDLKSTLSQHRFYVHTADPKLEDGFNLAMFEAMAAGLPVLSNCHPTSIIKQGISGFLSDDPKELHQYALRLMADRDLAKQLGENAKKTIEKNFSLQKFGKKIRRSIEKAQNKWRKANKHQGNNRPQT